MSTASASDPVLVVGAGLAGLLTTWELVQMGQRVVVVSDPQQPPVSRVAGGLATPIRGLRFSFDQNYETQAHVARTMYRAIESATGQTFLTERPVVRILASEEEFVQVQRRREDETFREGSTLVDPGALPPVLRAPRGALRINGALQVQVPVMLTALREWLRERVEFLEATLLWEDLIRGSAGVRWRGRTFRAVVLAQGWQAARVPPTQGWDWRPARGIVLRGTIEGGETLAGQVTSSTGTWLVSWAGKFLAGSTYSWDNLEGPPRKEEIAEVQSNLARFLRLPFAVTDSWSGVRPCLADRQPVLWRKETEPVWVLNGLASVGILRTPRLVRELSRTICQ